MMLTVDLAVAIIAIALASIPLLSYTISRFYFRPTISIRVSGEQSGDPIPLHSAEGSITIGITTEMKKEVALEEIRVDFNPDEVELNEDTEALKEAWSAVADKGTVELRVQEEIGSEVSPGPQESAPISYFPRDPLFPATLRIAGSPLVTRGFFKMYAWKYRLKTSSPKFQAKLTVSSRLQEHEIGAPWDMFPPKLCKLTSILRFEVDPKFEGSERERLLRYGFMLGPKESVTLGRSLERR